MGNDIRDPIVGSTLFLLNPQNFWNNISERIKKYPNFSFQFYSTNQLYKLQSQINHSTFHLWWIKHSDREWEIKLSPSAWLGLTPGTLPWPGPEARVPAVDRGQSSEAIAHQLTHTRSRSVTSTSQRWSLRTATATRRTGAMWTTTRSRGRCCRAACPTSRSRRTPSSGGSPSTGSITTRWAEYLIVVMTLYTMCHPSDPPPVREGVWPARDSWWQGQGGGVQHPVLAGHWSLFWEWSRSPFSSLCRYLTGWRGWATEWSAPAAWSPATGSTTPGTSSGPCTRPGRSGTQAQSRPCIVLCHHVCLPLTLASYHRRL